MEYWKKYIFSDGYIQIVRGLSKFELKQEEAKHGKVVSISKVRV